MNGKKIGVNQNSVQANSPISSSPSIKIVPTGAIRVGYLHTTAYSTLQDAFQALNDGEIDCVFPVSLGAFDAEKLNIMTTSPFIETEIYLLANKDVHNNISVDSNMIVAINQTNANEMSFLKAWQSQFRA